MNQSTIKQAIIVHGREKDLGGFAVRRSLPTIAKRSVGPFVFLDHMGPMTIDPTHALDVRPHPHIGLATVTYLFAGEAHHKDSLGSVQVITPGDLNWMTAGKGIVHSEHTPIEHRERLMGTSIHGIQIWVGLPVEYEDCEPSFTHWPKSQFPKMQIQAGLRATLLLGEFQGQKSPTPLLWKTLFMDCHSEKAIDNHLSFVEKEIALYVIEGAIEVDGNHVMANDLIVVSNPQDIHLISLAPVHFIVIGGDPFPEPRYMWWNFVSSSKDKIRTAAQNWKNQTMGKVDGETDFIPLSNDPLP